MGRSVSVRWANFLPAVLAVLIAAGVTLAIADRRYQPISTDQEVLNFPALLSDQRATVSLTTKMIQPIVSADGMVGTNPEGFVLKGAISDSDLAYKLVEVTPVSVKALIQGGPAGFDCRWVGLVPSDAGGVEMQCAIPPDVRVVEGLRGTMVIALAPPVSALALPLTAVIGRFDQGQVVVVRADGSRELRAVQIGVSDSTFVEVVAGLTEGERVLAAPVQSDLIDAGR